MKEPIWLTRQMVEHIHYDQIQQHGGTHGIRTEYVLESAPALPQTKFAYEDTPDLALLAAAYGFGIAQGHAFLDGNKRVAFMALYTFLGLNGFDVEAPEAEVVEVMLDVASGQMDEEGLADWVRAHMVGAREE
ncbi:type II toxin-antitoxin system death-on-curing family toxin [Gemmatimonadota bacterium]